MWVCVCVCVEHERCRHGWVGGVDLKEGSDINWMMLLIAVNWRFSLTYCHFK